MHALTCVVMLCTVAALAVVNSRRHLYFAEGSTTTLRFGHGWPATFQEGAVPGPGRLQSNPDGVLPNFVWGFPEFNDRPEIMASYERDFVRIPHSPWELSELAVYSWFGVLVDLVLAMTIVVVAGLSCEAVMQLRRRPAPSCRPLGITLLATLAMCLAAWCTLPDVGPYAAAAYAVFASSCLVTALLVAKSRVSAPARSKRWGQDVWLHP